MNEIQNIQVLGSLGYSQIASTESFDLILCNVPARIGQVFIKNFIFASLRRLTARGELRIVVIHELKKTIDVIKSESACVISDVVDGPRHTVYVFKKSENFPVDEQASCDQVSDQDLYTRDTVSVDGLNLKRPYDIGGDERMRHEKGLPVILDTLPRAGQKNYKHGVLCLRSGYGVLPLVAANRWSGTKVIAWDRDLLGIYFTQLNSEELSLPVECYAASDFSQVQGPFDLITGELSPGLGPKVAEFEISTITKLLSPSGEALLYCFEKLEREWIKPITHKYTIHTVLRRDGYAVLRVTK
jgi:hypothetical protein